ncbi:tetratricopeptide repeat protein [Lacinutrix sp. Bg11-31]|uniref:tetratricopeptide repeat-containing sensor histidine kinase n=1 Tax=Lacinutrix sp. Bg11-31 TaxID=2057808 RepID=UPI000C2FFC34|nr:tetratricopeptide repeat protein [Lacinutrix sp. Bg11-31]AUC82672.1 sensor histidine kinase [Lacinutrix sp. Bg11-31]
MTLKIILYKNHCLTLLLLLCTITLVQAQKNRQDFNVFADSIIKVNHKNYSDLEYVIYKNKYDTLKMRVLLNKSKDANYPQGQSFANIMLGNQYRNKSLFNKSRTFLNNALQISKDHNLLEFKIVSLNMLGVIDRRQDNVRSALDYHQEALAIAEAQPVKTKSLQKSIAVSHNSMGNIYLSIRQYDQALEEFNKSLAIEIAAKNELGLAINYHNIGAVYEAHDKLEDALASYFKSLEYNEHIDSDIGRVICKNSIGAIYVKQNKPEAALEIIEPTIALAEKKGDKFYIASAYITLGWAQSQLGKTTLAKQNLEKGLEMAENYNLMSSVASANKQLSLLNEKLGNPSLALKQYKTAVEVEQSIINKENAQYINSVRFEYETEKKNTQIKFLAKQNEVANLKLDENRKTAIATIIALFLLVAGLFFFNRHKRVKNEKKILTLEQDMLRSQMNPHFIFNSLNSIKLYIINNEKENAVYYLNKFSKLIRKILIASTEKEISLAEELETMDLYMNIENIRFSNEISYSHSVDNGIDIGSVKIPSLVLQPFLENALWHGLSSKKEDKTMTIHVSKKTSDFVIICITDNGIGRKASAKIKEKKLLKRKSVGIDLTKQRLEHFSKNYTNSYKLNIEDLYNNGKPIGTKVIIEIPIKETHGLKTA